MKVIVDTSVWSLALRRQNKKTAGSHSSELQSLILDGRVQMIGAVRQELLSGIKEEPQFKKLEMNLRSFPDLPAMTADYVLAAKFFNICRSNGVQGSNTDFLICAIAANNHTPIFTTDGDFTHFAEYLPILLHTPE